MNLAPESQVLIQGITEPFGRMQALRMRDYGTNVVAGVSPGYEGDEVDGIPVFDLVEHAIAATGSIETTLLFLPPYQILDAALEALAAGIRQLILVTRGVPPLDMMRLLQKTSQTGASVLGPGSQGVIVPDRLFLGTQPTAAYTPGNVGIISRYGDLSTEVALTLAQVGLGQSICIHLGNDNLVGTDWQQWLQLLEADEATRAIVFIGGVGGDCEEMAAQFLAESASKPTIAYLAGCSIPSHKQWEQPSAFCSPPSSKLLSSTRSQTKAEYGSIASKLAAFKQASIPVAESILQIPVLVSQALKPTVQPRQR